jgi:OmpA family protein
MLKKLLLVFAATFLLGACASPSPPPPPPPPPPMAQAPTFMVFFDWDSSQLSPASLNVITQAVTAFRSTGNARVTATGHTDTTGPDSYNMALSLRRANAVKNELVRQGVPADAIAVIGKGESQLLVQTGDNVREPQNRRVEIVIGGTGGQVVSSIFSDPRAYCKALSDKVRQFRTSQVDTPEAAAMAQCEAGNYQAGIPVLEDSLITNKIPLPAPGYRWPGQPIVMR